VSGEKTDHAAGSALHLDLVVDDGTARGGPFIVPPVSVVIAGLEDDQFVVAGEVDEAVFLGDATGPGPLEGVFEWLGFADALVGIAQGVLDEPVDPFEDLPIGGEPGGVILPPLRGEGELHD
jgi:hypothetical protein